MCIRDSYGSHAEPAPHDRIEGLDHFDKVINVDQSPIGRTPRSNPATYTGLFTPIRELFAEVPASRERGYGAGRFSFNVSAAAGGGRCEACEGDGVIKVEMHFLPDMYVPCDVCHGARYNRETLEILYKGKNITQVLELTVEDAFKFFNAVPNLARKLQTLLDVGLGYIRLGQMCIRDRPKNIESYYQETGRAGRDGLPADAWMTYGLADVVNQRRMIDESEAEEDFKRLQRGKLDALLALSEAHDCRRVRLLSYFGQDSEPCGNCDNCLNEPDTWDATEAARKMCIRDRSCRTP